MCLDELKEELKAHPERLEEEYEDDYSVLRTPLMAAAENGNGAVVKFLTDIGAKLETKNQVKSRLCVQYQLVMFVFVSFLFSLD